MKKNLTDIIKTAATHLENFDFGAAANLYREALKLQPHNAAATMGLAMVLNRTGQPAEALKYLDLIWKSLAKTKSKAVQTSKGAVLAQVGLAQHQLGRLADALQSYRQAHDITPSPELAGRIKQLQQALERPEPLEQLLIQAVQLQRGGKLDEAIKIFRAALQLNADHPEALHGLAMALRAKKDFNAALPILQQAIILAPERHDYYNDLGMLFQEMGELQKAVSFHNRALKLKADFTPALVNLGVAYKRLEKYDDAIAAYRKAIAQQPNMPEVHNNLGNLLRIQGDLAGAHKELQQALALKPGYTDAAQNLAAVEQLIKATKTASPQEKVPSKQKPTPKAPAKTPQSAPAISGKPAAKPATKSSAQTPAKTAAKPLAKAKTTPAKTTTKPSTAKKKTKQ